MILVLDVEMLKALLTLKNNLYLNRKLVLVQEYGSIAAEKKARVKDSKKGKGV